MYQRQLSFGEAINSVLLKNYCNFQGRAARSEFWWFALFSYLLGTVLGYGGFLLDFSIVPSGIVSLALLLPNLGVTVRRLHDVGRTGWWILISLIPFVGFIFLVVWLAGSSQMRDNQYGPVPNMVA